jgi:ureidoacrylate peracid hydrolase
MNAIGYDRSTTALLVIDPYNDFISEGGKVWDRLKGVAEANHCISNWCSSGFANTDLDLLLKRHDIQELIVIGLIAHTCVEATVRFAAELGYAVTVVRDATADYSDDAMHAALDVNLPNYASAIVTTSELVETIAPLAAVSAQ